MGDWQQRVKRSALEWLSALVSWPVLIAAMWLFMCLELDDIGDAINKQTGVMLCLKAWELDLRPEACGQFVAGQP